MKVVPSPYAALLARSTAAEHTVDVAGTPAHYWEYNADAAGPTLLVVHGYRGDHHGVEPFLAYLPGVHAIAPDLPGFGVSPALPGEHSLEAYAAWLPAFMDAVGLGADTVGVGHSFGTMVFAAAIADGLQLQRVVLINAIAAPVLEGPSAAGTRIVSAFYRFSALLPEAAAGALLKNRLITRGASRAMVTTTDRGLTRWIHNQHDRYFTRFADRRVLYEAFRASVEHDVSEFADRLGAVPVHLIGSERDGMTALPALRALAARIPAASLLVIPDVGHLVHYETPEAAAREIARVQGLPWPVAG